jgi:hypothetical protein
MLIEGETTEEVTAVEIEEVEEEAEATQVINQFNEQLIIIDDEDIKIFFYGICFRYSNP